MIPLVRSLKKAIPGVQLAWVVGIEAFPLVEGIEGVEFVVFDKSMGWKEFLRVGRGLHKRRFDVLLAVQASFRANLLYSCVRATRKIGFDRRRARDGHSLFVNETIPPAREHFVDAYLSFARFLGVEPGIAEWNLTIAEKDREWAHELAGGYRRPLIALNLSTSKPARNWLPERFAELIRLAGARWNGTIVLTGGASPLERELGERLTATAGPEICILNSIGRTSLGQLLALLSRVDVLISCDTGPVHLADALGTPVVGLYAAAPAQLSGPYNSRHLVVDKFEEAARRFLGREAGDLPWTTRVHHAGAMALIEVGEVFEKLVEALDEKGFR